jgi:hypothetical protein
MFMAFEGWFMLVSMTSGVIKPEVNNSNVASTAVYQMVLLGKGYFK